MLTHACLDFQVTSRQIKWSNGSNGSNDLLVLSRILLFSCRLVRDYTAYTVCDLRANRFGGGQESTLGNSNHKEGMSLCVREKKCHARERRRFR